jgi:DNA-binding beta-propeller fold protein YncE
MRNRRVALIVPAVATALLVQACSGSPGVLGHPAGPAAHRRPAATLYIYASLGSGSGANVVIPVNTATNTPGKPIHVGMHSSAFDPSGMIAVTPDGKTVYVTYGTNSEPTGTSGVIPISTATGTPGRPIHLRTSTFTWRRWRSAEIRGRNALHDPYFIAVTPDGKTAYVTFPGSGTVTPISTATNTPGRPIHLGGLSAEVSGNFGAGQIVFTPDGKTAYVTSGIQARRRPFRAALIPINTATNTPGKPIRVGKAGVINGNIVITPDGKTVYALTGSGTVTPISTATNTLGRPIQVGGRIIPGIAVTPDGKTAYVSTETGCVGGPPYCTLTVTPVNTATNTPGTPIHIGSGPWDCTGQIVLTPDGKTAYVTTGSGLTPISTATNTPGTPIKVGASPSGSCHQIVFTPDGKTAYVTTGSGVTPISTATDTPGTPIKVAGGAPWAMAIMP